MTVLIELRNEIESIRMRSACSDAFGFCQIIESVVLFLGTEKIGQIESAVFVAVIAGSASAGRFGGSCRARFIAVAAAVAPVVVICRSVAVSRATLVIGSAVLCTVRA